MNPPVKYMQVLDDFHQSLGNPPCRWIVNQHALLHRLGKPLSVCVVSGGVSKLSEPLFEPESKNSYRVVAIERDSSC